MRMGVVTGYHLRVLYAMGADVASCGIAECSGIGIIVANRYNPLKRG